MRRYMHRFTAMAAVVISTVLVAASVAQGYTDRIEKRAQELALPDDVLDPSWPSLSPGFDEGPIVPSLQDGGDEGMYLDEADREEIERYLVERGIIPDPDLAEIPSPLGLEDQLGAAPEGSIGEEYGDPTDW